MECVDRPADEKHRFMTQIEIVSSGQSALAGEHLTHTSLISCCTTSPKVPVRGARGVVFWWLADWSQQRYSTKMAWAAPRERSPQAQIAPKSAAIGD